MFDFFQLGEIHLEPTENCNAACPMCGRFSADGSMNRHLDRAEFDLGFFQRAFPNVLLERLERFRFCGNFGDPVACRDLLEIVAHSKAVNPRLKIRIHTNGGLRSTSWWAELASHLKPKRDRVYFALDGLEDTHSRYRRNVDWKKVVENAKAFVAAGGHAVWVMLVFKHNEHQVDACEKLSRELGFAEFKTKYTKRFVHHKTLEPRVKHGDLEPSSLRTPSKRRDWSELRDLSCRAARRKSLYVSAKGLVFPCCWTASQAFSAESFSKGSEEASLLGDLSAISLHHHDLRDILDGRVFGTTWPGSIETNPLRTCRRICANPDRPFESQWDQKTSTQVESTAHQPTR